MALYRVTTDELYHHGIKGQHWGVRNGPPYPIEDKVLRKGTRLNSVSLEPSSKKRLKNKRWTYTYNPKDPWDTAVYRGAFAVYKTNYLDKKLYDHQYEVAKDLKMPTYKERVDEFVKMYGDKKLGKQTAKDLQTFKSWMEQNPMAANRDKYLRLDVNDLKTKEDYNAAYELFNRGMEYSNQFKSTKAYSKIMSKKYDAMVDDNNRGVYNGVHDPIIIFKADKALKNIGDVRLVSEDEIAKNFGFVKEKVESYGRPILL